MSDFSTRSWLMAHVSFHPLNEDRRPSAYSGWPPFLLFPIRYDNLFIFFLISAVALGPWLFYSQDFFFSSVMFSSFLGEAMMERERMTERVMVCLTDGWMNGWMDVKLVLLIIGHLSAHVDDTVVWNCTLSHHVS